MNPCHRDSCADSLPAPRPAPGARCPRLSDLPDSEGRPRENLFPRWGAGRAGKGAGFGGMVSAGRCAPWGCARCVLCVCPFAALPVPVRVRKLAEKRREEGCQGEGKRGGQDHCHKGEAKDHLGMRIPEANSSLQHPGLTGFDALQLKVYLPWRCFRLG